MTIQEVQSEENEVEFQDEIIESSALFRLSEAIRNCGALAVTIGLAFIFVSLGVATTADEMSNASIAIGAFGLFGTVAGCSCCCSAPLIERNVQPMRVRGLEA